MASPNISTEEPPSIALPLDCAGLQVPTKGSIHRCKSERAVPPAPFDVDKEWVLAVAMSGAVVFTQSMLVTAGLLYVYFMEDFGASRETAAWPTNLKAAVMAIAGLLVPLLQRYLSLFQIAMVGSFLVWISPMICVFATDMTLIIVFLGAFQGAGMGIVETVVAVAIGTCFQKCRSIAMGLKEGGHTIAGLIFPKILSSLTAEYGLHGALGVCGALCLHVTAFMLTLRREPFSSRRQRHFKEADNVQLGPPMEAVGTPITDIASSFSKQSISSSEHVTMRRVLNGHSVFTDVSNASGERVQAASSNQHGSKSQRRDTIAGAEGGLFQRNQSFDDYKDDIGKHQRKIFLSPGFYTKIFMFAIAQYGVVAIKAVVVDYGLDKGVDRSKAELMVTYSAASDFIGRIAIMAFADHGCMSRILVTVVALLLHSVTTLVLPLTSGFEAYLAVWLLSSMMQSSLSPLVTVIVADYHGAHRIPLVWGLSGFMAIPLQFATPSITGFFRDTMGSYDYMMFLVGGMSAFAGLLGLCLWISGKKEKWWFLKSCGAK